MMKSMDTEEVDDDFTVASTFLDLWGIPQRWVNEFHKHQQKDMFQAIVRSNAQHKQFLAGIHLLWCLNKRGHSKKFLQVPTIVYFWEVVARTRKKFPTITMLELQYQFKCDEHNIHNVGNYFNMLPIIYILLTRTGDPRLIRNKEKNINGFLQSVREGLSYMIKPFISFVNPSIYNNVAVELACYAGHTETVRQLVEVGCVDVTSERILQIARQYEHIDLTKYLLTVRNRSITN
jgi:hypothetical protein